MEIVLCSCLSVVDVVECIFSVFVQAQGYRTRSGTSLSYQLSVRVVTAVVSLLRESSRLMPCTSLGMTGASSLICTDARGEVLDFDVLIVASIC